MWSVFASVVRSFRPYKASTTAAAETSAAGTVAAACDGAAAGAAGAAAGPSAGSAAASSSSAVELQIEEVYKPGRELRPLFEELGLK